MENISVLVVDDHDIVREGTRRVLEHEEGISVIGEACDGLEAVKQASKLHPDVVVMDIAMPGLNGIEATKRIKAENPATAVLILTIYDNDQYIFGLLEAGAAGYLLKNVHSSALVEAIRSVYQGESVLHPSITSKVLRHFMSQNGAGDSGSDILSQRELGVLRLAAKGLSNKEIADRLYLSVRTVQGHLTHIFNKTNVGSRTEAILQGLSRGWLNLEENV